MFTRVAGLARLTRRVQTPLIALLMLIAFTFAGAPSTLAAPSMHGEGIQGVTSGEPEYTHHMTEKIRVSEALCGKLKAAYPSQASDPDLCFATHTVEWTDMTPLTTEQKAVASQQANSAQTASGTKTPLTPCDTGNVSYHDKYNEPMRLVLDLKTSWVWYGYCAPPTITSQTCYVSFSLSAEYKNQQCYSYTYPSTNPDRRAAVYQGTMYFYDGPNITVTQFEGQRRECFATGYCYWTSYE